MRISVTVSIMASQDAKELPIALTIPLFSFCPQGTKRDYVTPYDRPSPNLDTPFILALVLFHFFILSASQPISFCRNDIMYY